MKTKRSKVEEKHEIKDLPAQDTLTAEVKGGWVSERSLDQNVKSIVDLNTKSFFDNGG